MSASTIELLPVKFSKPVLTDTADSTTIENLILGELSGQNIQLQDGDILVIASKIVSHFEGRVIKADDVKVSRKARIISKLFCKKPVKTELILQQGAVSAVVPLCRILSHPTMGPQFQKLCSDWDVCEKILNTTKNIFMVKLNGYYMDDAGIDISNTSPGYFVLLPMDPYESARKIRSRLKEITGKTCAIILTDTVAVNGQWGSRDIAIGFAGIDPIRRLSGTKDIFGVPSFGGTDLVVDGISAMAGLVMGQHDECTPMAVFRNLNYLPSEEIYQAGVLDHSKTTIVRNTIFSFFSTVFYLLVSIFSFSSVGKQYGIHAKK